MQYLAYGGAFLLGFNILFVLLAIWIAKLRIRPTPDVAANRTEKHPGEAKRRQRLVG
jgi:hypothetical protein